MSSRTSGFKSRLIIPTRQATWLCLGEELLQLVEAVRPAVPVEVAARLGLEGSLGEGYLRRLAEVPERQLHQGLDVVSIRRLPDERERQAGGRLHFAELAGQMEGIALMGLHLDAVAVAYGGAELEARDGE